MRHLGAGRQPVRRQASRADSRARQGRPGVLIGQGLPGVARVRRQARAGAMFQRGVNDREDYNHARRGHEQGAAVRPLRHRRRTEGQNTRYNERTNYNANDRRVVLLRILAALTARPVQRRLHTQDTGLGQQTLATRQRSGRDAGGSASRASQRGHLPTRVRATSRRTVHLQGTTAKHRQLLNGRPHGGHNHYSDHGRPQHRRPQNCTSLQMSPTYHIDTAFGARAVRGRRRPKHRTSGGTNAHRFPLRLIRT